MIFTDKGSFCVVNEFPYFDHYPAIRTNKEDKLIDCALMTCELNEKPFRCQVIKGRYNTLKETMKININLN